MKHLIRSLALLLLFLLPLSVFAKGPGTNTILPSGQVVNGNYFGAGNTVRVDGTVNGDAYVAGGTVTVNGTIDGDLLAAGGTVLVKGNVTNNIRVAGGTVTITGQVGRNITVAGGTVTIEKGAHVHGSMVAAGGTFDQMGQVDRDLTIAGGTLTLAGPIGGSVNASGDQIIVASLAKIAGNFSYLSTNNAQVEKGAVIAGHVDHRLPPQDNRQARNNAISGFIWGKLISLVALYIIGLLFLNFFPKFTDQVVEMVRDDVWRSIGFGILILIFTPPLILFFFLTLVGIPFAVGLLFAYIMLVYIGKLFVAMYLGKWATGLMNRKVTPQWALFIGLVLHLLITLVPVLGWIAGVFIMVWGMGAYILAEKELYRSYRKKDLL